MRAEDKPSIPTTKLENSSKRRKVSDIEVKDSQTRCRGETVSSSSIAASNFSPIVQYIQYYRDGQRQILQQLVAELAEILEEGVEEEDEEKDEVEEEEDGFEGM